MYYRDGECCLNELRMINTHDEYVNGFWYNIDVDVGILVVRSCDV